MTAIPQPQRDFIRRSPGHLPKLLWALRCCIALLLAKVFVSVLLEYRWYFPANFDASAFLSGRRHTFAGIYPIAFYTHILCGPPTLVLSAFLLLSGGRKNLATRHRWAGRTLAVLVLLLLFPSGLAMAWFAYGGPPAVAGFAMLSSLTALSVVQAAYHARGKRYSAHRRWAQRSFLLLASPLILRIVAGAVIVMDIESLWTYRLNAWLSWLVPLVVYELMRTKATAASVRSAVNVRSQT